METKTMHYDGSGYFIIGTSEVCVKNEPSVRTDEVRKLTNVTTI